MLELETKFKINADTVKAPNLADKLSERDLDALGNWVWEGFNRDKFSRQKWEQRTQAAMDLAMQVQKEKNFPWPGCSNVAFPLITIATMQFHSRAYPAILHSPEIVKYKVNGPDPMGEEYGRAKRVGEHMSYQLMEEDSSWEEQHDRLLINIPIVGCAFKKTYYSGQKGHNVSELVLAQDLVLDYFAKSVEECGRKTHIIPKFRNDIYEGVRSGIYLDILEAEWYQQPARPFRDKNQYREDQRLGMTEPSGDDTTPFTLLEQHCWIDMDGDGYQEPYVVTIEENSKRVLRMVTRFDTMDAVAKNEKGQIIRIKPVEYFTKYGFIPSPDGGIYDVGFGVLLGPINESVNSILNQLVDAGTMAVTAGGFLGRGAKIRGGQYTFAPLEWKRVDSTGDDLKKNIFPLPVREPSGVLFNLLSLLIDYTNRISGTTEAMVGESTGQNTPATTTQSMVEQGQKIFSAIFKRVWRSMKEEFKKLYVLNSIYLPMTTMFGPEGQRVLREDYKGDPNRITPTADPSVTSDRQRQQLAMTVKQLAMQSPGYNVPEVERNLLKAMHVDGIDIIYPGPEKIPPQPNPKVQIEQMKAQVKQAQLQADMQKFAAELMEQRRLNSAKILQLEAQAAKLIEEAGGVQKGHEIAAFEAAIGALKTHDEAIRSRLELFMKSMEGKEDGGRQAVSGVAGSSGNKAIEQIAQRMEGGG